MTDQRLLRLYIPVQQAILNYWMGELPLHQTSLLLYINERTLRYGKPRESINRSHFLDAVRDKNGRVLHNGINLKHSSLWKFIKALEASGLVVIEHKPRDRRGNIYEIDVEKVLTPVLDGELQTSSKSRTRGRRIRGRTQK